MTVLILRDHADHPLNCEWWCQACGAEVVASVSGNNLPRCKCNGRRWGRTKPDAKKKIMVQALNNSRDQLQAKKERDV